jgi:hypothetical protein
LSYFYRNFICFRTRVFTVRAGTNQFYDAARRIFFQLPVTGADVLFFVFRAFCAVCVAACLFLIFTFGTVTEYGYYTALQHFSTAEDLENVIFGTNFDNKLDAVMIYFNWTAFVPCLVFLILLLVLKPLYEKD